jgi:hypothetical protein
MERHLKHIRIQKIVPENDNTFVNADEHPEALRQLFEEEDNIVLANESYINGIETDLQEYDRMILEEVKTEELDLITKIEILSTGLFAYIYNADVYINKNVPDNVVYLIAAPEFTGVMPIKTDINQKDNLVSEEVGMAIVNTNSILKIEF